MNKEIANKIRKLFNTKLILTIPKQKKILIYDKVKSEVLLKYFAKSDTEILCTRYEELNLYCAILSLFTTKIFKFQFWENYFLKYISIVKPRLIITMIDNDPKFWVLSKKFNFTKTCFVQNARRLFNPEEISLLIRMKREIFIDYMFIFGNDYKIFLSKYFFGKFLLSGSIINNIHDQKNTEEKNTICFISQFGAINYAEKHNFEMPDKKILLFLRDYSKDNKKKLIILDNGKNSDKLFHFCKKNLNQCDWSIHEKKNIFSSYKKAIESEILVTADSTLGYEMLARGKKVAFFSTRRWPNGIDYTFGSPGVYEPNGSFWTNYFDTKKFTKILDFLYAASKEEWENIISKHMENIMIYSKNNKIFKEKIDQILSQ